MSLFVRHSLKVDKKDYNRVIHEPILFQNFSGSLENAQLIFVTDELYKGKIRGRPCMDAFHSLMGHNHAEIDYAVVSSVRLKLTDKEIARGKSKMAIKHRFSLETILPKKSIIISIGDAIYSLTKTNDLHHFDFIDNITGKTKFYLPTLESYVFPVSKMTDFIGIGNLYRSAFKKQLKSAINYSPTDRRIPKMKKILVEDTHQFFQDHKNQVEVAVDTETDSLDWTTANIGCVTFAFEEFKGYYLRWKDIDIDELNTFLGNKFLIWMNGKYDTKILMRHGVLRKNIHIDFDCWQGQHVWKENNLHNSLKSGAWRLTNYGGYDLVLEEYKKKHHITNYLDIPEDILSEYAIQDACITFQIYKRLTNIYTKLDEKYPMDNEWSVTRYVNEIVMPTTNLYVDVEYNGLRVIKDRLTIASDELQVILDKLEKETYEAFGIMTPQERRTFSLKSPLQVAKKVISLGWEIDPDHLRKDGLPKTDEKALEKWIKLGYEPAKHLLELRKQQVLMGTFVGREGERHKGILKGMGTGLWQYLRKTKKGEHYIYPNIHTMVAGSGRSRHSDPNLANIPAHGDKAKFVRRHFAPDNKDYVFLSVDASGLQLRLGALASNDREMRNIFINQDGDLHSRTAYGVLCNGWLIDNNTDEVIPTGHKRHKVYDGSLRELTIDDFMRLKKSDELLASTRFKAKAINFGNLFGAMASTFAENSLHGEWTIDECWEFINDNKAHDVFEELYDKHIGTKNNISKYTEKENRVIVAYLTVATVIRERFFETYSGLADWIDNTRKFGTDHGYVRSTYGAFRRLPFLYKKVGNNEYDKKRYSGELNVALNSPIQNSESVMMNRLILNVQKEIDKLGIQVRLFDSVHDAHEFIVHKDDLKIICELLDKEFKKDYTEYNNIPFELEGNVADYWKTYETDEWQVWDIGPSWERYLEGNKSA